MLKHVLFAFSVFFISNVSIAGNAVWWEGESAAKNDFVKSDWLNKTIRKTRLSNMDWLSCYVKEDAENKKTSYSAKYEIDVPADSDYTFWAREFYRKTASPWKFRFDGGKWTEVTKDYKHKIGSISDLGRDRSVVWCKYGKFKLTKGKHKFEIEISEREKKGFQSGFDCFLLTDVPFSPDIWKKPQVLAAFEYIGTFIWIEGETAESNFINGEDGIVEKSQRLSKDKWLACSASSSDSSGDGFTAKWKFIAPIDGSFHIWMREYTKKNESPFLYRLNDGKWKRSLPSKTAFDPVEISDNDSVCWVNYKKSYISEGENTLEIKIDGENNKGDIRLAIDAILFSLEPVMPQGKLRPDTKIVPPEGWFVSRPRRDIIDRKNLSAIDMRKMNDSKAGVHGFCKIDSEGFVFKDGTRPRFWGMNVYDPMKMDNDSIDAFVRQMAKFGVNLIRINGTLCNPEKMQFGKCDKELLDRLYYFIAQCKRNGVYVALANYDPADYIIKPQDGFEGYTRSETNNHPYGLLYTNKKYRNLYKKWAKFLKNKNPYTKIRLYKDPTIVWFEIQTGKSILADALKHLPKAQKDKLDKQFNQWLIKRHGDLPYALRSWSTAKKYHPVTKEDGRKGARCYRILPFDSYKNSVITSSKNDHFNKRKVDQLRFIAKMNNEVNRELIDYLRKECKFQGLISTGNSMTAAPFILGGLDAYMKSSGDIIAGNAFVKPWRPKNMDSILKEGTLLKSRTVLKNPLASPVIKPVYKGKANVVSEISWLYPNRYRSEAVPFISAYAALHGNSTNIWYQANSNSWISRLTKYSTQSPAIMGLFPGYALMFRRGDVKKGDIVVKQKLNVEDIFNLKGDGLFLKNIMQKQRLRQIPDFNGFINPFAYLVGRVESDIVQSKKEKGFSIEKLKIRNYVNTKKGTVKSSTGELALDYHNGRLIINTPRAQAFVGFSGKDITKKLKDVTISTNNTFGNILVIALDDQPIASSSHILIQAFSEERNSGWKTEKVPKKKYSRLLDAGDAPLVVKNIKGHVAFHDKKQKNWEVWKLDSNGYRVEQISLSPDSTSLSVTLPGNALYVELKKR